MCVRTPEIPKEEARTAFNLKILLTDASNNPLVCDGGNKVRVSFGASIFLRLQHVVGILKDRIVIKSDHFEITQK